MGKHGWRLQSSGHHRRVYRGTQNCTRTQKETRQQVNNEHWNTTGVNTSDQWNRVGNRQLSTLDGRRVLSSRGWQASCRGAPGDWWSERYARGPRASLQPHLGVSLGPGLCPCCLPFNMTVQSRTQTLAEDGRGSQGRRHSPTSKM